MVVSAEESSSPSIVLTSLTAIVAIAAAWVAFQVWKILQPILRANTILDAQPNIPVVPADNPLGMTRRSPRRQDLHKMGVEDSEIFGGIYRNKIMGFYNLLQISDPWLMAEFLDRNKYPELVDKPQEPMFYRSFDEGTCGMVPPEPSSVSTATADPLYKTVRKLTSVAFNPVNIREGFHMVGEVAGRLVDTIRKLGPETKIDMDLALQAEAFDVIGKVGYAVDFKATADLSGPGAMAADNITHAMALKMARLRNPFYTIPGASEVARLWPKVKGDLHRTMYNLMMDMKSRPVPPESDTSIWANLMRVRDKEGKPLSTGRLWSEVSVFFIAGMETTGHTMSWALYLISQHPEVEAKIMQELDSVGLLVTEERPMPRDLEYADIGKLPYLAAVMKEALRMYTPVPMIFRQAKRDLQVGPYVIPKGQVVLCHLLAMHNNSQLWDRPQEFRPERFLEPSSEYSPLTAAQAASAATKHARVDLSRHLPADCNPISMPYPADEKVKKFLPFADGVRSCVGLSMGQMAYMAAMARLLSNFSFKLHPEMGGAKGVRKAEEWRITIVCNKGIQMNAIPRPCA
eukprot:jgi/Botrbrau1/11033/Bobra.92_2s0006.1